MFSKNFECIPVAPTLPISSLSTNKQQVVRLTPSVSSIARSDVKAHALSSCPYPIIILLSIPQSFAFPTGTISNSAEIKSSSSISYIFFKSSSIFSFTASFSIPFIGLFPTIKSNFSPSITLSALFSICSADKCTNKSVITKIGSSSFSPITISCFVPSLRTTTPCIASGNATHWYFFIPP